MVFLSPLPGPLLCVRGRPLSTCFLPLPTIATAFRLFPHTAHFGTDRPAKSNHTPSTSNHTPSATTLVPGLKHWNLGYVVTMEYKAPPEPLIPTSSPSSLAQDFARHQVSKQQRSNYHSSSPSSTLPSTMVSRTVNKTGLHPAGVQ